MPEHLPQCHLSHPPPQSSLILFSLFSSCCPLSYDPLPPVLPPPSTLLISFHLPPTPSTVYHPLSLSPFLPLHVSTHLSLSPCGILGSTPPSHPPPLNEWPSRYHPQPPLSFCTSLSIPYSSFLMWTHLNYLVFCLFLPPSLCSSSSIRDNSISINS